MPERGGKRERKRKMGMDKCASSDERRRILVVEVEDPADLCRACMGDRESEWY